MPVGMTTASMREMPGDISLVKVRSLNKLGWGWEMVSHGGFIAYYRVSTGKQGKSGLGIEAQRQAVATYLNGGNWRIIAEFTEIESGKRSDRPELDKALAAARARRVPLVVAKVDRLTRSVSFLHGCSMPASMFVLPTCRRLKALPANSCCSRWQPLPSLRPA